MKENLIQSALGFTLILFLASCGTSTPPVQSVEVRTIEIARPAPIVPEVDQLDLRPVNWVILTPDNVDEQFAKIKNGELVFFALTAEGYENIALNLSDIRGQVEQYKKIIAIYKSSFK